MRKIITLILLIIFCNFLAAEINGKLFNEGKAYFVKGNYSQAEKTLKAAIKAEDLEESAKLPPDYHYWLGKVYVALQDFELAYENMALYYKFNVGAKMEKEKILNILRAGIEDAKEGVFYKLERMPGTINSIYSDFAPVTTNDNTMFFFTSARPSEKGKENIWKARKVMDYWSDPTLCQDLSTDKNESLGAISQNMNHTYLFGNYTGTSKSGDIYESYLNSEKKWAKPQEISGVNSDAVDIQPYVFNDEVMFFTSNREGGLGGFDLYVSFYELGSWSEPQNLGAVVNTEKNEQTPFLDWDGKTLYFASDGQPGLGHLDIFKTTKGETWQDWSEPVNLGITINSVRNDRYYFRMKDKGIVYMSSDRIGGKGYEDIYRADIKKILKKEVIKDTMDVVKILGLVSDEEEEPMADVKVSFSYQDGDKFIKDLAVTDSFGRFNVDLKKVKTGYIYHVSEKEYFDAEGKIVVGDQDEIELLITLIKLPEKDEPFIIENIYFEFNKAVLKEISFAVLDNLASTLINNPGVKIEISGYTDSIGSESYNMDLSLRRADSVIQYLIDKGVSAERLLAKGYGESNPIETNETDAGRASNRRVEMKIVENGEVKKKAQASAAGVKIIHEEETEAVDTEVQEEEETEIKEVEETEKITE